MKINQIVIEFFIESIFIIKFLSAECGLPAIPFNAQVNQVKHNYQEGDSIQYHCELDGLTLVGNPTRICFNDRWIGNIPRCVQELNYQTINQIEWANGKNENETLVNNSTVTFGSGYKPKECVESREMSRPHSWKLNLTEAERHISYIELSILNKYNKLTRAQTTDLINSVKVNDLRKCGTQLQEYLNEKFVLNVTCSFIFDEGTESDDWVRDQTDMISFEVNDTEITICEIRIYKTPDKIHHWCGSADAVPHSRRQFIRKNKKHAGNSHYSYFCNQGFQLEGNQDIRCGADNNWLDEFPICKPVITCPFTPLNKGIAKHTLNPYHSDGIIIAVVGTVVYHFCEADPKHKTIMIGDSVIVCEADGDWSGIRPMCIPDTELQDYLEHIEDINQNHQQIDTSEPLINDILSDSKRDLSCGIPAMPVFAKPITQPKLKYLNRHSDLRSSYSNGTVISYQCESAYTLVTGDMYERTCVNGKWEGKVGQCAITLGNKLLLNTIIESHLDEHGEAVIDNINEINNTNFENLNKNFVFKYDPIQGQCFNLTADKKQQWTLRLNKRDEVTYFMVMLYPGGFFGGRRHVTDPEFLRKSPLSANTNEKPCVLTSAWDYNDSKSGTYFHFTCALDEKSASANISDLLDVILSIDPDQIIESYKLRIISICSLAVFKSKYECGSPDIPAHGSAQIEFEGTLATWTFTCDQDYELVGETKVKCGKYGYWLGEFPICEKKEACSITNNKNDLQIEYKNLIKMNDKNVATIGSVANHSCKQSSGSKTLLIGSKLRVCDNYDGYKWSGSDPFCLDPKVLTKDKVESHLNVIIFSMVLSVFVFIFFVGGVLSIVRKKMKAMKNMTNHNNIESPYTL